VGGIKELSGLHLVVAVTTAYKAQDLLCEWGLGRNTLDSFARTGKIALFNLHRWVFLGNGKKSFRLALSPFRRENNQAPCGQSCHIADRARDRWINSHTDRHLHRVVLIDLVL
jgi:hypothetical protein